MKVMQILMWRASIENLWRNRERLYLVVCHVFIRVVERRIRSSILGVLRTLKFGVSRVQLRIANGQGST